MASPVPCLRLNSRPKSQEAGLHGAGGGRVDVSANPMPLDPIPKCSNDRRESKEVAPFLKEEMLLMESGGQAA